MREIPLSQGLVALVDDEDFERINQHKWYAQKFKNRDLIYASRNARSEDGRHIIIRMHREIMGLKEGDKTQVDHRDTTKTLDNRTSNLRLGNHHQNGCNVRIKKNSTTGLKGVSPGVGNMKGKWRARIRTGGERLLLGHFNTPEEAKRAYDAAAELYHGEFARKK